MLQNPGDLLKQNSVFVAGWHSLVAGILNHLTAPMVCVANVFDLPLNHMQLKIESWPSCTEVLG